MSTNLKAASGTFTIGGDLTVNRLGFGAMRITGEGVWGDPKDPKEARAVLRRTIELGIDFIDTADSYGPETSELLIAEALHPYPKGLLIATKGGLTRSGPNAWDPVGRAEYIQQCVEMSLRRLKLDCIDLYQLHRFDPKVPMEETLGALKKLQGQGKIRHIGLSEVSVEEIKKARQLVTVVSVQNLYNLAHRFDDALINDLARDGTAHVPFFPLGGFTPLQSAALSDVAKELGATPMQVALAWLLQRAPNILLIPGTSSAEHLRENIAAASLELPRDMVAVLDQIAGRQIHRISGLDAEGTIPGIVVAHRPGSILAWRMSVRDDDLPQHCLAEFLPPNLREAQKELLIARQLLNNRRRLAVERFAVGAVRCGKPGHVCDIFAQRLFAVYR